MKKKLHCIINRTQYYWVLKSTHLLVFREKNQLSSLSAGDVSIRGNIKSMWKSVLVSLILLKEHWISFGKKYQKWWALSKVSALWNEWLQYFHKNLTLQVSNHLHVTVKEQLLRLVEVDFQRLCKYWWTARMQYICVSADVVNSWRQWREDQNRLLKKTPGNRSVLC